jgi:hypothetical protein
MPTLNWIGKEAVVKHPKEVPFRLLEPVLELSCEKVGAGGTAQSAANCAVTSGNLIVQGDNLHALKALLPRYTGQVKCIYIDPPYNTGNEGWGYNDNVNSPEIRKWLGEVVGKEGETLTVARVAQRVRQGGHNIPEAVVRRRFGAGRENFERLYAPQVYAWASYDNSGTQPLLMDWSVRP